jgi:hypothetical protein
MVQGGVIASFFIPACGQVVFDPYGARPTDLDLSVSHPDAAVLPYDLGLVADAPTVATVVSGTASGSFGIRLSRRRSPAWT